MSIGLCLLQIIFQHVFKKFASVCYIQYISIQYMFQKTDCKAKVSRQELVRCLVSRHCSFEKGLFIFAGLHPSRLVPHKITDFVRGTHRSNAASALPKPKGSRRYPHLPVIHP